MESLDISSDLKEVKMLLEDFMDTFGHPDEGVRKLEGEIDELKVKLNHANGEIAMLAGKCSQIKQILE